MLRAEPEAPDLNPVVVSVSADERCLVLAEEYSCFQSLKQCLTDGGGCAREQFVFDCLPAFFGLLCPAVSTQKQLPVKKSLSPAYVRHKVVFPMFHN